MTAPRPLPPCGRGVCVSTRAPVTAPLRRIEPLAVAAPAAVVLGAVLQVLGRMPRARVLERDDLAVHAVVRSAWLRVPTDVEVRIDAEAGRVDLRMATPLALRAAAHPRGRAEALLRAIDGAIRSA